MKILLLPADFQIRAAWQRTMTAMDSFTTISAALVRVLEHAALLAIATDPANALRFALLASELRREMAR